jgi:methyl-accepting chemotaxis protein
MKVATKLRLLVAISVAGLLILGIASYTMLNRVKVGGPIHDEMNLYSDLYSDIVPPALDIERVRFASLKMLADVKEKYPEDIALFQDRKKQYLDAMDAWKKRLPDGPLKEVICEQSYNAGVEYINSIEQEMIPALERGDHKAAEDARRKAVSVLDRTTAASKKAVEQTHAKQSELDASGRAAVRSSLLLFAGVGLIVGVLVVILGLTIGRGVSAGTTSALQFANTIASGDLSKDEMKVVGQDELSELARALNQMKANLREKDAATSRMVGLADQTKINIMFADRDLKIQYLNPASKRTLEKLEQYLPVRASEMLGKSIDVFHKHPEQQKRLLSDPRLLPHTAQFNIGPEVISLTADAVRDSQGNHIGSIASWEVVTEKIRLEALNADYSGQVAAIGKSQAVVEYNLDGTVMTANENFLRAMGYSLDEVKGKHHAIFTDESERLSGEYKEFWAKLSRGEYVGGEFKRIGKGGKEVWVQASYNPILDVHGKPFKVVEYASDTTPQKKAAEELNRKVDSMLEVVSSAAEGDLTREVTVSGQDAIGRMGEGLSRFFKDLRRSVAAIVENSQSLASASEELSSTSQQMSANAEETSSQANVVTTAATQVDRNLQTVATGTEEMSASIKEIAKNAHESAKIATEAVRIAEETNATVSKLGTSSVEIGQVIKVITSIAQQTNLLALNATIEAARAGEAGKGFAVVANEVKELAKQTAKATEDISRKIEAIQGDTKGAVSAIDQIGQVIRQVNDISNTIATAVEEQNATTNEMSRNVSEAARGSEEITKNIGGVAEAAQSTSHGANDSLKASQALARMSTQLRELVSQFKIEAGYQDSRASSKSGKAIAARTGA